MTKAKAGATIDKVALIHIENRRVLLARSHGKDTFYAPGGKRIGNESDIEALVREIREELGVEIVPSSAKYYNTFTAQAHGKLAGTLVSITCYTADFVGKPSPDHEIAELGYFDISAYDKLSEPGKLIFTDLQKRGLID
jgi:8-oxo-dGTP pyrophosphatase MutT (NUDIX family)